MEKIAKALSPLQDKVDKDQAFFLLELVFILIFIAVMIGMFLRYRLKNLESIRKWEHDNNKLQEKVNREMLKRKKRKENKLAKNKS